MSEVHRYQVVKMFSEEGNVISYEPHGPWVVTAEAHDRELSALREELATVTKQRDERREMVVEVSRKCAKTDIHNGELRQRLTAAEQRNATTTALLQRVIDSSVLSFEQDAPEDLESLEADICAAIKPTESGASE